MCFCVCVDEGEGGVEVYEAYVGACILSNNVSRIN